MKESINHMSYCKLLFKRKWKESLNSDDHVENNEHYFLHCKLFVNQRNVMFNNIRDLGLEISINNILYGHSDSEYGYSDSEYDVNCTLFVAVHRYIMDTKRFV